MSTILVTGASGFVGSAVFGMSARGELDPQDRFVPLAADVDLREPTALQAALRGTHYDAVIHLAAISFVPESIERPTETYDINLHGTINLLEALKQQGFSGAFLYVSSGDVYGAVPPEALPVTEERIPRPRNPYAAAKLAAEAYCCQAAVTSERRVLIARPFNHIGAGQSERFFLPAMARQIVEIKQGRRAAHIETGNIDVTRDFSDVRDVVHAYVRLLASGRSGEVYNVCSGIERNVGEVLRRMLQLAGVEADIKVAEEKLRPNEQRRHCGSNRKLCDDTGWQPRIPFDQSLHELLRSWNLI
jgi:GDP-4-dehydro-6-deoxy-D-mannose reductase